MDIGGRRYHGASQTSSAKAVTITSGAFSGEGFSDDPLYDVVKQ